MEEKIRAELKFNGETGRRELIYDLSEVDSNLLAFLRNAPPNAIDPDGRNPCMAYALYRAVVQEASRPDTWKHCYVTCMGARCDFGLPGTTVALGGLLEILQLVMDVPHDVLDAIGGFARDLESNGRGLCCAFQIWRSCESCCEDD